MNKNELSEKIAVAADISKASAQRALNAFLDAVGDELSQGGSVSLVGFGTFSVSARAERTGRNPKTGEALTIHAKKVPSFKPGSALKDSVN
jgi:DNA-binding protein HU-beta